MYNAWTPPVGSYTLTARPYTAAGGGGTAGTPLTISFSVIDGVTPVAQQVTSFVLVNADNGTDIQALTTGATLNLASLPTRNLNVRANTSPATVGSVVLALSGAQAQNQTESVVPYALFSDNGGVYNAWTPPVGSYSLTARPYTAAGGGGTAGTPLTISFSVTDQALRQVLTASGAASSISTGGAAYPNPSVDGRFRLRLPGEFVGGDVRYRLVSVLGATLATGTLSAGAVPRLDFSHEMLATGLYYLLLETQQHTAQLKLLRN